VPSQPIADAQPVGHDMAPHDGALHATSHAHAVGHVTPPVHELLPVQSTLHGPGPHVVVAPHALTPAHDTAHAPAQRIEP